jgi:cyclin-dependent kinase 12/13
MSLAPPAQVASSSSKLEDYEILHKCGEGTYGCVYKAVQKSTRQTVALKKIVNVPKEDGNPVEVKYLSALTTSKNVVGLKDSFWTKEGELCLVFEFMDYDLWRLSTAPSISFNMLQIKCIMKQMLEGLQQCHSKGIVHRDTKPSNLLINAEGTLKLADFGLATSFLTANHLSNNVVSLYYRPPELLMGSHAYGPEIDIWSVGCILIELVTNNYLFAGANETEQLDLIFRVFGTPSEESWPGVSKLPGWGLATNRRRYPTKALSEVFSFLSPDALDLISKLMSLDPKKRITSADALVHPWFCTSPLPCPPSCLPNNWVLGGARTGSYRKYQEDFPRSRKLYMTSRDNSTSNTTRRRYNNNNNGGRGRRGGGGNRGRGSHYNNNSNTGRSRHVSHYSPYQCRKYGYSARNPIVIE